MSQIIERSHLEPSHRESPQRLTLESVEHLLDDIEMVSATVGADYAAQNRTLFRLNSRWISLNLIGAVTFAWMNWGTTPTYLLAPWLLFITASATVNIFLSSYFSHSEPHLGQLPGWCNLALFMTAVTGLTWGAGSWLLLPHAGASGELAFLAIVIALAVASIPLLAMIFRAYLLYGCATLAPVAAYYASNGANSGMDNATLSAAIAGLLIILGFAAWAFNGLARRAYDVAGQFSELVQALSGKHAEYYQSVQLAKHTLAEQQNELDHLRDQQDRATTSLQAIGEAVITTDKDGKIDFINPVAEVLTGWSSADVIGRPVQQIFDIVSTKSHAKEPNPAEKCLQTQRVIVGEDDIALICKDGLQYAVDHVASPIRDRNDQFTGVVLVFRDVTERRRAVSKITWRATHDPLTGLLNRSEFETRLSKLIEQPGTETRAHALCYLDLDHFKAINDTYGHNVGDEFLKALANMLKIRVRGADTLARLGGDEFAVLLYSCPVEKAKMIAEGLHKVVDTFEFDYQGEKLNVGVSIGVIELSSGSNLTDVLGAADAACYVAKRRGRNTVHVYDDADMRPSVPHRDLVLLQSVQRALTGGGLKLFYQTIHPLAVTGNRRNCALSVRMNIDSGELLMPGDFLKAAEHYHLMPKIDQWTVKAALDAVRRNHPALVNMQTVSINISGQSLNDDWFLEFILDEIEREPIAKDRICLQIDETSLITDTGRARFFLASLKQAGCIVCLGDYGIGLSSFSLLKSSDIDYIRIGREFIRNMEYSSVDFEIVLSLVRIARTLGIQSIAEGVTSESASATLRGLGVDYVQGFLTDQARPLESTAVVHTG